MLQDGEGHTCRLFFMFLCIVVSKSCQDVDDPFNIARECSSARSCKCLAVMPMYQSLQMQVDM